MTKKYNSNEEIKNKNQKVIILSLFIGFVLMCIKFVAYFITKSNAILTDAAESIVNVVAAAFAAYSVYLANQPRDLNHPYGHGKVEFFSAGLEGILIILAGIITLFPSIWHLWHPQEIDISYTGIALIFVTLIVNFLLGNYLKTFGQKNDSLSIEADGIHLLTDAYSSIALLLGLLLIKFTGYSVLDSLMGLVLAAIILYNGIKMLRKSITGLMDEMDPKYVASLLEILEKKRTPFWIDVHNFRVQKHGADTHIDCHLTLPYYISLHDAHNEVVAFENVLKNATPNQLELFIHSDPCIPACCSYCQVPNCAVRSKPFENVVTWNAQRLFEDKKHFEAI